MRNCRLLLVLCLSLLASGVFAQKDSVYYFNKEGMLINRPDTAGFYRVINSRDSAGFSFTEYRKDGMQVKATAGGNIGYPRYNGNVTLYSKNGKPREIHIYTNGVAVKTMRYHPNGLMSQSIIYKNEEGWGAFGRIVYEADSTGKANIVNGNGTRKESGVLKYGDLIENYAMEGAYKAGAKDGTWKGTDDLGIQFEEEYYRGKLLSGKGGKLKGKKNVYQYSFEYPLFSGGQRKFDTWIKENLKNPADTLYLAYNGRGHLRLNYTIDEKGRPVLVTGFNTVTQAITELILKHTPDRWEPAKIRGVPVSYKITYSDYLPATNKPLVFNTDIYLNGTYRVPVPMPKH